MQAVSHITRRSRTVRRALARDQHSRVALISLVQLIFSAHILVGFLTLSAGVAKGAGERVLALLMLHACFSVFAYLRSRQRGLEWYHIVTSMAVEFGLCLEVMFFQSHILKDGGAALGAAPMFGYVYLFVAMRVLHFRSEYVLLAGLFGISCWAALLAVTLGSSGIKVASLTFKNVLLSGAVDKVLSLVSVTIVLAHAARQARRHLESSIVRGVAGDKLSKLVSQEVADQVLLAGSLRPGQGRMAHAAILMMDIRNFSRLATSMSPEHVLSLLQEYQSLMVPIIIQRGGCIDKFMGDGILAHFGAISRSETSAVDALRTVEALLVETDRWNASRRAKQLPVLEFGAAATTGSVIFGALGGVGKTEYTIIGHAVNLTAKLEKHTKELDARALCTRACYDEAVAQGYSPRERLALLRGITVSGLNDPIDLVMISEKPSQRQPGHSSVTNRPAS